MVHNSACKAALRVTRTCYNSFAMDQVAQIRDKIDIVSFLSEFITVKKAGRNFRAICPFHNEKSPSFMISPEKQVWHCFGCFPPGEKVKTPFGYHNIEDIDENHWVVSGKGMLRKVIRRMERHYRGELVHISLRKLGGEVKLTSDHNVLAIRGAPYLHTQYKNFSRRYNRYLLIKEKDQAQYYSLINKYLPIREIPAGELQRGDLLLYPINRREADLEKIDLSDYISKSTRLGPVPRDIPLHIPVDSDFLKLIGYWIAEGSSHRAYIRFSLGNHEEEFAAEIVQLIKKIFGLEAKIYRRPNLTRTGIEVTACHSKLANIFENLCGKGAANKHIPFIFQELPIKKQKIILHAIRKGDGTLFIANRSTSQHKSITTISRILAEQIVDILLRMQLFPTQHVGKAKLDKLGVNHREAYTVLWSEETRQKYNVIYYEEDGTEYWLLPITKLKKEPYEGPVYNFTVDKDHSYIATNFAVANCGKGGDAYTFLMDYEKIEFPEALRVLAKKAGIELVQTKYEAGVSSRKEQLYSLNRLAAEYYHYVLTKHKVGEKAREYLKQRGLSEKIIETFQLGFAPGVGNALTSYLMKKKSYSSDDLLEAGLVFSRGREVADFFRGRLVFPLIDHRDNVVGFSGRVLDSEAKASKYMNTRETLIYHKGEGFYGLNITKEAIRKANHAILMEGEFDVISSFQEGVSNVVAIKGTALTEQQITLIGRYAQKISFCFDGDRAGQVAIKRSLPIVERKGLQASIILIPDGKDPDEAIKNNAAGYKQAIKKDIGVYDYLFEAACQEGDVLSAEGKKTIADTFLPVIASMTNEIVKEHYLRKLSTVLETTYESISKELSRKQKAKEGVIVQVPPVKSQTQSREEMLEEYLMSLIVQFHNPKLALERAISLLSVSVVKEKAYQKILEHLLDYFKKHASFDEKVFSGTLPSELAFTYNKGVLFPLPPFSNDEQFLREIEKVARQLRDLYLRTQIKLVSEEIVVKEKTQEPETVEALKKEYASLLKLLSKTN